MYVLDDKNKFEVLLTVRQQRIEEIRYLKERNWNVTTWLIGIIMSITSAIIFLRGKHGIISVPIFALAVITTFYLNKNYRNYKDNLECLTRIDHTLGLFKNGYYLQDESIYSGKWSKSDITFWGGVGIFIIAIWVITYACIAVILLQK